MPDNIRSLIVICTIVLPLLIWLEGRLPNFVAPQGIGQPEPAYWHSWLILTGAAFLIPSLPIFLLYAAGWLISRVRLLHNAVVWYWPLAIALPSINLIIGGGGLVNYLITMNWPHLLTLVMLIAVMRRGHASAPWRGTLWVGLYATWLIIINLPDYSLTQILRYAIEYCTLDVFLPFWVARQLMCNTAILRKSHGLFVASVSATAALAIFEHARRWLLYPILAIYWHEPFAMGHYLLRGGALRAAVSTGHPLALGFALALGFVLALPKALWIGRGQQQGLTLLLIAGGLYSTLARGSWVGTAVGAILYGLLTPGARRSTLLTVLAGIGSVPILAVLPGTSHFIDLLPWIGKADVGSTAYRAQLLNGFAQDILAHPIRGVPDFATRPELQSLRQGEHMIDLVNTYLGVAVGSGLVGLFFFVAAHVSALWRLWRLVPLVDPNDAPLVRSWFCAYVTALIIMGTTSPIQEIPLLYWSLAGMAWGLSASFEKRVPKQGSARPKSLILDQPALPNAS